MLAIPHYLFEPKNIGAYRPEHKTGWIRLYGGRHHGERIMIEEAIVAQGRIQMVKEPLISPHVRFGLDPVELCDFTSSREISTYHIQEYRQVWHRPRAFRNMWIGVLEGCDLFREEEWDLSRDIQQMRWEFPEVSFLQEFDEWMAQAMYRIYNQRVYKGRPWG